MTTFERCIRKGQPLRIADLEPGTAVVLAAAAERYRGRREIDSDDGTGAVVAQQRCDGTPASAAHVEYMAAIEGAVTDEFHDELHRCAVHPVLRHGYRPLVVVAVAVAIVEEDRPGPAGVASSRAVMAS